MATRDPNEVPPESRDPNEAPPEARDPNEATPAPLLNGCPKCGRAQVGGASSCPRCGLVFALWKGPAGEPMDKRLDERGEELWSAACEAWADEQRHDAFVKHCSQANLLGLAGRLYRERIDATPRDPVALKMQARIVGMVTAVLQPLQAQRPSPVTRSRWFWVVVGVAVVGGAAAGVAASYLRR